LETKVKEEIMSVINYKDMSFDEMIDAFRLVVYCEFTQNDWELPDDLDGQIDKIRNDFTGKEKDFGIHLEQVWTKIMVNGGINA
jgi:hypothetical protein